MKKGFIVKSILDYVESSGDVGVTHREMDLHYRKVSRGSNSFSHILPTLRKPVQRLLDPKGVIRMVVKIGSKYKMHKEVNRRKVLKGKLEELLRGTHE